VCDTSKLHCGIIRQVNTWRLHSLSQFAWMPSTITGSMAVMLTGDCLSCTAPILYHDAGQWVSRDSLRMKYCQLNWCLNSHWLSAVSTPVDNNTHTHTQINSCIVLTKWNIKLNLLFSLCTCKEKRLGDLTEMIHNGLSYTDLLVATRQDQCHQATMPSQVENVTHDVQFYFMKVTCMLS